MTDEITSTKMKFNRSLEPIKVMLVNKKDKLDKIRWDAFVERTKESIMRCPDQYLGRDLPNPEILSVVVKEIFADFVSKETSN